MKESKPLSRYQLLFMRELDAYGGVCTGMWCAASHYAGLLDREGFEAAIIQIQATSKTNLDNQITALNLASIPISLN